MAGLSVVGKAIGGACQAISIMIFNKIYQFVLVKLTDFENWQTDTQVFPLSILCIYMHTRTHKPTYANTHAHKDIHMCIYMYMFIYVYICVYVYIYV